MSRIASIEAVAFTLPLRSSLAWGQRGRLAAAEGVLVRVRTAAGATGVAEAPPRPTIYGETSASIEMAVTEIAGPLLVGLEIDDHERADAVLEQLGNNLTARGALDMALHDALAQESGVSLRRLLGSEREAVPVSYILGLGEPEAVAAEARTAWDAGVRVFKVKVGGRSERDLATIAAVRDEIGDDALELYADANETLPAEAAAERLATLAEAGIRWVEEPLPVELLEARSRLRAQAILPLIGDDSAFTPEDLRRELAASSFDILNVKPARSGYRRSLEMLALAHGAGLGAMVGSQASTTLGTARAAVVAGRPEVDLPSELSFFLRLDDEIVTTRLEIHDGLLALDQIDEIAIDEKQLARFTVGE